MPSSIRDIWPDKWLKPAHLQGHTPTVAIEAVTVEDCYNPRSRRSEARLIVAFHNKHLRLILNRTQALALAAITGEEDYSVWPGYLCQLSAGIAPNGQATVVITPAPDKPARLAAEDPDSATAEYAHRAAQALAYLSAETAA